MFKWLKNLFNKEDKISIEMFKEILRERDNLLHKVEYLENVVGFYEFIGVTLNNCENDKFDYEQHYLQKLKKSYVEIKNLKSKLGKIEKKFNNLQKVELLLLEELDNLKDKNKKLLTKYNDLKYEYDVLTKIKPKNIQNDFKQIQKENTIKNQNNEETFEKPETLKDIKKILNNIDIKC